MEKQSKHVLTAVAVLLMTAIILMMGGCSKSEDSSKAPESSASESSAPESTAPESSVPESSEESSSEMTAQEKAELSERAMQNFLNKIQSGNYVMNSEGFLKTTVYSDDLVWFDYEDDGSYSDFAVMSVNNEVFQGFLEENGVRDVSFLKEGTALETAKPKLPAYWLTDDVSEGNIYNLFYNDTEDPLKFVSYDTNVQNQVRSFVGYGQIALNYMHEVYLVLDAEDPTQARLQCVVDDDEVARYYFDDIDVVITFGDAQSESRAQAWMGNPEYPEARTEWTEGDLFVFNSVFLPGYGDKAIPFIPTASYALMIDEENFVYSDEVDIRDSHATLDDVDAYKLLLVQNGFEPVEEDGEYQFRKLLREDTKCYSSISVTYNDGMDFVAKKYYDFPKYEGLDSINGVLTSTDYPALPETQALTELKAYDTKAEQIESWLYFFDYETVLYVYAKYGDYDQAMEYLDAYIEDLKNAGYTPVYIDPDDEESGIDHYTSPNTSASFRYHFEDDNETVILLFKNEKYLTADETEQILKETGFPEIDLTGVYVSGRNHKKFNEVMYGKNFSMAISFETVFETQEAAEAFLDNYVALLDEDGYLNGPGSLIGSNKQVSYRNEASGLGLAFDFYPSESGETRVYFECKGGIDFEAEDGEVEEDGPKPLIGSKNALELAQSK